MRKITLTIFGILLIGIILVTAQIIQISISNREIDFKNITISNELKSLGLNDIPKTDWNKTINGTVLTERCLKKEECIDIDKQYQYYPSECEDDDGCEYLYYNYTITKCNSIINTCSGYMDYTELDDWEQERLNTIADVSINRKGDTKIKSSEGITTIK